MYTGLRGTSVDYSGASWCGSPPWSWFCSDQANKSTVEQIITDTSDYGSQLSPTSRQTAEDMARQTLAADMTSNPCAYSEISGMGWTDKLQCDLGLKKPVSYLPWLIGGVAALLFLRR